MLLSVVQVLLSASTIILSQALVKVAKIKDEKFLPYFKDLDGQRDLQSPAIWYRKRDGYTEVCFKTQTKWLHMGIVYYSRPRKEVLNIMKLIPPLLMNTNQDHLKDSTKNRTLSLVTLSNTEEKDASSRLKIRHVFKVQVYLPELLEGHIMRLPCSTNPKSEKEKQICKTIKPVTISMEKKCFFAIPMHKKHFPEGYETHSKLADQMVKKLYKDKIVHPISFFHPLIYEISSDKRSAKVTRFFETTKYLYTDDYD